MRALAGLDALDAARFRARDVEHLHAIAPCQADEEQFVIRSAIHIGRHGSGGRTPFDALARNVDGDQFVTVLHRGVDRRATAVHPQVAWCAAGRHTLRQDGLLAIPTVEIHVVQTIRGSDQPLHVGRETQMVRVNDAMHRALHLGGSGIDKHQCVGQCIGNDQRLFVRREVKVMRLLASRKTRTLLPSHRIDDADAGIQ